MSKEAIVYWGVRNNEEFRFPEPTHLLSRYLKDKHKDDFDYITCPGFLESMKNMYTVHSNFDFEFTVDNDYKVHTPSAVQTDFLQKKVIFRSPTSRTISVMLDLYLFSEEPDLDISVHSAFFDQTPFVNNTIMIPGTMSISNWYRPVECAFHLKNGAQLIKANINDPLLYIKFHTDKKIKFVKYEVTDELEGVMTRCVKAQDFKEKPKKLPWYYNLFIKHHLRKRILKLIKGAVYD